MFGIGPQELILILVGALIIFGPQRLPEIASQAGKMIRDFRRMSDDLTGELRRSMDLDGTNEQVLTNEVITASETPQPISETISQALRVESIPFGDDEETTVDAAVTMAGPTSPEGEDTVLSIAAVATKAEPLNGASLLDEPTPYVGITTPAATAFANPASGVAVEQGTATTTTPVAEAGESTTETTELTTNLVAEQATEPAASSYSYEPTPVPASAPLALDTAPEPTNEADAVRLAPIADAWDAVVNTEVTLPATNGAQQLEYVPPPRIRIDPEAEVTIREKIEAQVAAEAFRERRRIAHYRRPGNRQD